MTLQFEGVPPEAGWTIQRAEDLLASLPGVISVRVVARPGGEIDEIHLLTDTEVEPKQTVRNVESALKAQFHLEIDHRKISVARSSEPPEPRAKPEPEPEAGGDDESRGPVLLESGKEGGDTRILFVRHQVETERAHRVKVAVSLEWNGKDYTGEAVGTDLPRARLEAVAKATLAGIEEIVNVLDEGDTKKGVALALDGVKMVEAFDRNFAMVGVNAIHGREIVSLAGASAVEDTPDRAVILATLQATDRWVRGRL